jgi:hypothetical protein
VKLSDPLPLYRLSLPVANGRRFFVKLPSPPFPDDAFLLDHTLEAFDRFFEGFILAYDDG